MVRLTVPENQLRERLMPARVCLMHETYHSAGHEIGDTVRGQRNSQVLRRRA